MGEWPNSELVLVVDAANVVGSRPDGWWRDRQGATERLRDELAQLAVAGARSADLGWTENQERSWRPRTVLVVEGKARGTAPVDGVDVVPAETDGDSEIVRVVKEARARRPEDQVVVATADRQLRARIEAEGATALGPAHLLALLRDA